MKLKSLFSVALLALSTASFAQDWTADSIAMGVGYANDVFYELKQGATTPQAGNNWDLAFQTTIFGEPSFNAAIRANHARKALEVYSLHLKASTNFTTLTAADTVGKTGSASQLINNDTSWGAGAFYQNRNVTEPFSYGWGQYAGSPTHAVNGDSLYLLRVSGIPYKLWIQKYVSIPADSIGYTLRIAKLDGSNDNTITIYRRKGFADKLFAYYDIASNTVINREPTRSSWDIVFTQYRQLIPAGPGVMIPYNLTGVLSNLSVEVADVRQVNPDPNQYKSYARTTNISEIGSDWKTFNGMQYIVSDTPNFFIKTKSNNEYYQLQFTRFDGGGATGQGKVVFNKRYLGKEINVAVNQIASSLNAWFVTPNPAANNASVMIDAKTATPSARIIVTDMAGHTVLSTPLDIHQGMNAFNLNTGAWAAGMYAVQVAGGDWKLSTRLVVAH